MKKCIAFCFIIVFACSKSSDNNSNSLVGKWKLIETLSDPGDGSGTWMQTNSYSTIQFNNDSSAYEIPADQNRTLNHYSILNDSTTILFYSDNTSLKLYFKIEQNILTLMGGCIETCGSKYKRIIF